MEVSEDVRIASEVLTPHYTLCRYPGRRAIDYTEERATRCLRYSRLIVDWVRKVADPWSRSKAEQAQVGQRGLKEVRDHPLR